MSGGCGNERAGRSYGGEKLGEKNARQVGACSELVYQSAELVILRPSSLSPVYQVSTFPVNRVDTSGQTCQAGSMTTTTTHTCGGPSFGRRTPGCPRCDELLAGAEPVRWASRPSRGTTTASVRSHRCTPSCGPVCTYGEW